MAVRERPWPTGSVGWVGLTVSDVGAATGFYGDLLGWEFATGSTPDGRPYLWAVRQGRRMAGVVQAATPGVAAEWLAYLTTPDAAAVVDRAEASGAEVLLGVLPTEGGSAVGFLRDPTGAVVGLWQPGDRVGREVVDEPGTAAWVELLTDDVPAARAFYGEIFGVTFASLEGEPGYVTLHAEGELLGGIGPLGSVPDGVEQPHWLVYFRVAHMAQALTVAETHGGRPEEPFDTPFGRIAMVRGPEGELFALMADVPDGG